MSTKDIIKIIAKIKYKFRGHTADKWSENNPVLAIREPGLVLNANGKTIGFKIGDGVTPWNELEYHSINTTQVNTNLSNAYKTTKEGGVIIAEDISPLEHELKVSLKSYSVTDFSAVKVSRYGKNLFPIDKDNLLDSVGNYTFDSEGIYGNYGSGASNYVMFSAKYPVGTYSFSAQFSHKGEIGSRNRIIVRCFDADGNILTSGLSNYNDFYKAFIIELDDSKTFTIPNTAAYWCFGWVPIAETVYGVSSMKFPQLELGASITSYESCKRQTVTANADGVVEGLTSASPIMLLTVDNEDIVIECEYNKDINTLPIGGGSVDLSGYVTKEEFNTAIGDIETALDGIISIQNSLIGGDSV